MSASKATLFFCLLALCMAFVAAAPPKPLPSTTVKIASVNTSLSVAKPTGLPKSTSSKTTKSSSTKSSSKVSDPTLLQTRSELSAIAKPTSAKISSVVSRLTSLSIKSVSIKPTKSSSAKPSSTVSKSTLRLTTSIPSTTVKPATLKTSISKSTSHSTKAAQSIMTSAFSAMLPPSSAVPQSSSAIHPSFSSVSVPSPTLPPFNLTRNRYSQSAGNDAQSLSFHISDPSTLTKSECVYIWAGYDNYPPGYWEHTAQWVSCEDKTFSFKVTQVTPSGLEAWSYKLKHQYMGKGIQCVSPTDSECITTIGHADIRLDGNAFDTEIGDTFWCGASGNCGASKFGPVAGPIDSTCEGVACKGEV